MTEQFICHLCGEPHDTTECILFDDSVICQSCADVCTLLCSDCGIRIYTHENRGTSETPLCEGCYYDCYTHCQNCGCLLRHDDACYTADDEDEDYPICYSCYCNHQRHCAIHEYGYKPTPIFYGEGERYFGVELEIDLGGKDSYHAEYILDAANAKAEHLYIKGDGSLDDGMELVSHPMSLEYHLKQMSWRNIMKTALQYGYKSHKTNTCGLHIHVNRTAFGETLELQESVISRILYFIEHHWAEMLTFSRRTEQQLKRWAARYGYKEEPKAILDVAKRGYGGRYTCVNIANRQTIEFRIFRGTLKYSTFAATLQLVNEICNVAVFISDSDLARLSWSAFVSRLDPEKVPELITYLKERRLFVNEEIETMEDD